MKATSFAESIESMVSWSNVSLQASLTHFVQLEPVQPSTIQSSLTKKSSTSLQTSTEVSLVQSQAASSPLTIEFQPFVNSSTVISPNVSQVSASQASSSQN